MNIEQIEIISKGESSGKFLDLSNDIYSLKGNIIGK
jgi:hypothetical protein